MCAETLAVCIVTPAAAESSKGNWVTAERWRRRLQELGHRVDVCETFAGGDTDVMVALHARRSHPSIIQHAGKLVVALTGTDIYGDLPRGDAHTLESIERADRLVVLQPRAISKLPEAHRDKARVIYQSFDVPLPPRVPRDPSRLRVCVLANLRPVKDPLLAARAVRELPTNCSVEIVHLGEALDPELERQALRESADTPRYRYLGPKPRSEALEILAGSDLLLLTSLTEGGANVVTEAIACGTPVLSTRIEGSLGLLGEDYPGFFDVGSEQQLAERLEFLSREPEALADLATRCRALIGLTGVQRERDSWRDLLADLCA